MTPDDKQPPQPKPSENAPTFEEQIAFMQRMAEATGAVYREVRTRDGVKYAEIEMPENAS